MQLLMAHHQLHQQRMQLLQQAWLTLKVRLLPTVPVVSLSTLSLPHAHNNSVIHGIWSSLTMQ